MANLIQAHEKYSDFKEAWASNRNDMTTDAIFKEFVMPELPSGTILKSAKGLWDEEVKQWEKEYTMEVGAFEDFKEEDKAELNRVMAMSEEEFDEYMAETRREAMMVIRRAVTNTLRSTNATVDGKTLKNIKEVFDAITKMMLQREELLLKKQKARANTALKALDIFGRYGGDLEALEKMKSIVHGAFPNLSEGDTGEATVSGRPGDDGAEGGS